MMETVFNGERTATPAECVELRMELRPLVDAHILHKAIMLLDVDPREVAIGGLDIQLHSAIQYFNVRARLIEFLDAISEANPGASTIVAAWQERLQSSDTVSKRDAVPNGAVAEKPVNHVHSESPSILSGRVTFLLIAATAVGMFCWIAARAPQMFGSFPVPIYAVLFGPLVICVLLGLTLIESNSPADDQPNARILQAILAPLSAVICWIVSLQYFLILAPSSLCSSRPNFGLLWQNAPGEKITHCMGSGRAFDATAPYYLEPQWLQAWGNLLLPAFASILAFLIWRSSRNASVSKVSATLRRLVVTDFSPKPGTRSLLREIAGPLGPWLVALALANGLLVVALATGVYKPSLNLGDVGDVQLNPFAPGESVPVKPGEDIFTRDGIIVPDGGAVDDFKLPGRRL